MADVCGRCGETGKYPTEEAAFLALRLGTGGDGRIFYRHRPRNTARKAGKLFQGTCSV